MNRTKAAKKMSSDQLPGVGSVYCDSSNYCDDDYPICCQDTSCGGSWCCWSTDTAPYGTCCAEQNEEFCDLSTPLCNGLGGCCGPDQDVDEAGTCIDRTATSSSGSKPHIRRRASKKFPSNSSIGSGWQPTSFSTDVETLMAEKLQDVFFAWIPYMCQNDESFRETYCDPDPDIMQCYVIGFPSATIASDIDDIWDYTGDYAYVEQLNITWENTEPSYSPVDEDGITWCNDGDLTQTYTHEYSETYTDSYTMSVSSTFTASFEISTEESIEFVKETEDLTMTMSMTESESETTTELSYWSNSESVNVAGGTETTSRCYISVAEYDATYTATYRVTDATNIAWACNNLDEDYSYYTWMPDFLTVGSLRALIESYGFDSDLYFVHEVTGTFDGLAGHETVCSTHVTDIDSCVDDS